MSHFALAIYPATNDVYLDSSGNLATVQDAHAVGQHVRQRLKTFSGEWFLDTTIGVPWLSEILGEGYAPALAEAVVKSEILDTDGVAAIESFGVGFERGSRALIIRNVSVATQYDQEASV